MKELDRFSLAQRWLLVVLATVTVWTYSPIFADTGYEGATRIERGTKSAPSQVSVTGSATSIVAASVKRPDFTCMNNGTNNLFIGGDNTVTTANGFPVLSSATFKADAYTGAIFGVCDSGTCDVRCWSGTVQ